MYKYCNTCSFIYHGFLAKTFWGLQGTGLWSFTAHDADVHVFFTSWRHVYNQWYLLLVVTQKNQKLTSLLQH